MDAERDVRHILERLHLDRRCEPLPLRIGRRIEPYIAELLQPPAAGPTRPDALARRSERLVDAGIEQVGSGGSAAERVPAALTGRTRRGAPPHERRAVHGLVV